MNKTEITAKKNTKYHVYDVIILLAIPVVLFLLNPNIFFLNSASETVDAWGYLGYFMNLSGHVSHYVGGYPAGRLGITLFGALFYGSFSPVVANIIMKYVMYSITAIALYWMLTILFQDRKIAVTTTSLLVCHPTTWSAFGVDYTDGVVVLYSIISLSCSIISYSLKKYSSVFIAISAISLALLVSTHLFTATLLPNITLFILYGNYAVNQNSNRKDGRNRILLYIIIFIGAILSLSIISQILGGKFFYFASSLAFAKVLSESATNPWAYQCVLKPDDSWISVTIVPAICSIYSITKSLTNLRQDKMISKRFWFRIFRESFNQINYLLALGVFIFFDVIQGCTLKFYFSMLVPFCFLALSEFFFSSKILQKENYYKLIVSITLIQAIATLFYTRYFMVGMDGTEITNRIRSLHTILFAFDFILVILILTPTIFRPRQKDKLVERVYTLAFILILFFTNIHFFNPKGFYQNGIFTNIEQYKSYFEVTQFLQRHNSLYNSLFWYNANSLSGNHFRSIASNSFLAGNLVGEKYPYITSLVGDLADDQGQLNAQTIVDPGSRVIILTDNDQDYEQQVVKAFANQGLNYRILNQSAFKVGKYKFNVIIGDTQLFTTDQRYQIYSCQVSYDNNHDSISFNSVSPDCEIKLSPSQDIVYFMSKIIPVKDNTIYLISTDAYSAKKSFSVHLHDGSKEFSDMSQYIQVYNQLYFNKNNLDKPILNKSICASTTHHQHQIIFQSKDLTNIKLVFFNSPSCDSSSLDYDKNDLRVSNISIYELPKVSISTISPLPSISQNIIQDWWRVRYPNILVKSVDFDASTQLFKVTTNPSYEDFQIVSPELKLKQESEYTIHFKSQILRGGFSLITLASDSKTILSKSTFCSLQPQDKVVTKTLKFNTHKFKSAKIVIANYSNCLGGNKEESTFYIGDVKFSSDT